MGEEGATTPRKGEALAANNFPMQTPILRPAIAHLHDQPMISSQHHCYSRFATVRNAPFEWAYCKFGECLAALQSLNRFHKAAPYYY